MTNLKWLHLAIDLFGGRTLDDASTLSGVLDAFEDSGLVPATWAVGEPPGRDYARDEVEQMVLGRSATAVSLHRKRAPQYRATLFCRNRPRILVVFAPPPTAKHHTAIVALADALVASQRPHVGWLNPLLDAKPPFEDEIARARYQMDEGCDGSVAQYDEYGPGGLGAYTWLGAPMVALIGSDRLASAPVEVRELAGGGVRIDLVDDPLAADDATLAAAWTKAMARLADAEVFARQSIDEQGYVRFVRGARFNLWATQ